MPEPIYLQLPLLCRRLPHPKHKKFSDRISNSSKTPGFRNGRFCCILLTTYFSTIVLGSRMGSTSITTSSLYSHAEIHSPNLLNRRLGKLLKPPPPFINSHKPLCHPTLPFQRTKLHASSGHSHFLTQFCQSPSFSIPTSKLSHSDSSLSPQKFFSTFLSEKIIVFLIGSFIFMGCCKNRAAIALPAQTSSFSANMEDERDTQKRENEEEKMFEAVLEKDPRNVEALKVVLYGKMRRGKTKEAVKYVERLIDEEPDEVEWRLLMALCYETMGQLSKAKRLFKKILEERPLLLRALHV
jgi:hypothetical protein